MEHNERTNASKKAEELTEMLEQSLLEFRNSDKYIDYMKAMARFHNYSFNNVLLIYRQMPTATSVAGYTTWQRQHRQVKKEEHGLRIFAPVIVKRDETQEDGTTVERKRTFYRTATVFDISQTEGEEMPDITPESGSIAGTLPAFDELWERSVHLVPDIPVNVQELEAPGLRGYYNVVTHQIFIDHTLSETERVKTLIHEMAHAAMHSDRTKPIEQRECEAEGTAFVVCYALGFDTSTYSIPYVAGYTSSCDFEEITACMSNVQRTADRFIRQLTDTCE